MTAEPAPALLCVDVQRAVDDAGAPPDEQFAAWVGAALAGAGRSSAGVVTVRLVTGEESAALNLRWRERAGPTNVLAFPGPGDTPVVPGADIELGDLVICWPVARTEAGQQHKPLAAHLAHLVVHGTLHLVGYDHHGEAEAERMELLEVRIITGLGFADPYGESGAAGSTGF